MSADWPLKSITEIVDFNPPRKIKKGSIAPFVDMASLPTGVREISKVGKREFKGSGSKFQNGDTLFSRITPCLENGKTAKVTELKEDDIAHGSTEFIVMSAKDKQYDEDFVYYIARLPEFRSYAQSRMEGTSGRQRVPWQALATYKLQIPPKQVRKQIGGILSSIDDKIELNRQTSQTLEQIAKALFKSWFVDFEPVKAKIAAKQAGATAEQIERAVMCAISGKTLDQLEQLSPDTQQQLKTTAALFPDAMLDSELGEIPDGWTITDLKALAIKISKGTTPSKAQIASAEDQECILFLKVRDISDDGEITRKGLDKIPQSVHFGALKRSLLKVNDILFSIAGTIGRVAIVEDDLNDSNCNQALAFIRLKEPAKHLELCRLNLVGNRVQDEVKSKVVQGVQANFSLTGLGEIKILFPSSKLLEKFNESVVLMGIEQRARLSENRKLTELRDTLLPKLLSGELEIKENN
jgi:type I restriction enzyme S subunit